MKLYKRVFFAFNQDFLSLISKIVLSLTLTFTLTNAQNQTSPIPEVDDKLIETMLPHLIYGFKCNQQMIGTPPDFDPSVFWAKDQDKIDAQTISNKMRYVRFAGRILTGGIYDSKAGAYVSADKEFMYYLKNNNLVVQSICDKQQFTLSNYDKESDMFHIKLRNKPDKEVAIVINVADSMRDYVLAFKEIAPYVAKHILKDEEKEVFSKITLVSFNAYDVRDFDDAIDAEDFIQNAKTLKTKDAPSEMINFALIKAMSHFTKDNGLKKEIYLIADKAAETSSTQRMLELTKNLNKNIVFNSGGSKENWVKIHTFSLKENIPFLQNLAQETEGNFYAPDSVYAFKKELLKLSNDGKDVNPKEIGNEIIPAKTHKIYDPDDPNPTR
ncbi:hypothetical protein LS70_005795 [Helicobacter sp. MIT 11-5569]|uniref:hypothetical protein n=1 Tax=Helicobacter sp. MIT 11-5569 TaxID=1548151 RepID=UPI00051FBD52|nr:hypothetical protein [Helicobacter sp. MIT 11-5569]TLD83259.1 hypothetical protein LS70_005795 [Helicobacter sp. MIT 11-5569]